MCTVSVVCGTAIRNSLKKVMQLTPKHISEIRELCERYKVKALYAFGSVTTEKFNAASDVDLIVDFQVTDPFDYADNYFTLKDQLEQTLQKHVDLLEQKAIRNPFLKQEIDRTKVLVYGN